MIGLGLCAGLIVASWLSAAAADPQPVGTYRIIDVRSASAVASIAVSPEPRPEPVSVSVSFEQTLVWSDGSSCADWRLERLPAPPLAIADPMLSDVEIGPLDGPVNAGDRRLNQGFRVLCGPREVSTLLMVDTRVLVIPSPNGAKYAVAERPLIADQTRRLQERLRDMKFHAGPVTGQLDDATRRAVSSYAEYRGVAYRFRRAAITENLLEGLRVLEPPPAPSPNAR